MIKSLLHGVDVISADMFTHENLDQIFRVTKFMKESVEKDGGTDLGHGKIITALFYEPSSRTFGSFVAAIQRLGGGFIPLQGIAYSSVTKGETLPDTVRTFASYSDIVVIRHPDVGSAKIASQFSDKPVINAGDGVGEHPTQALLDLYTIYAHFGRIDGLTITMVGDLLNGRTIHSLAKLLSLYKNVSINLISPDLLKAPSSIVQRLIKLGISVHEGERLEPVLSSTDVLYVTRVQKERFTDLDIYEKLKHHYVVTSHTLRPMKQTAIIMHPFPRVGEITMDVDLDKRAVYIREQMINGMYVRMALLALVLHKTI